MARLGDMNGGMWKIEQYVEVNQKPQMHADLCQMQTAITHQIRKQNVLKKINFCKNKENLQPM